MLILFKILVLNGLFLSVQVESSQPIITENNPPSNEVVYIIPGNVAEEVYRRRTFENFPVCLVRNYVEDLAYAGFLYTGFGTRCLCFRCGNIVESWPLGIDVRSSELHFEDCLMPFRLDPDNIPLMQAFPSYGSMFSKLIFSSVTQERFVRGLNLRYESQRRLSFLCWPVGASINHLELARSGFAYLGEGLSTFCFICCRIISNCNSVESIQATHRRLSPNCAMAFESANMPSLDMHIPEFFENLNFPNFIQVLNEQPLSDQDIPDDAALIRNRPKSVSSSHQGIAGPSYFWDVAPYIRSSSRSISSSHQDIAGPSFIQDVAPRIRNSSRPISSAHQDTPGPSHIWDVDPQIRSRSRSISRSHRNLAAPYNVRNVAPSIRNRSRSVSSSHQDIAGSSYIRNAAPQIENRSRSVSLSHQDIAGPSHIWDVGLQIRSRSRSISRSHQNLAGPSRVRNVAPSIRNRSRSVSSSHQDIAGPSYIRNAAPQIWNRSRSVSLSHQDIAGPFDIRYVATHDEDRPRSISSLLEDIPGPSRIPQNAVFDRSALRSVSEGLDSSAAVDHAMLSEIVKYVLKLGFAYALVRKVVAKKVKKGLRYTSIKALVDDLLKAKDELLETN